MTRVFLHTVEESEASGAVAELYERARAQFGFVPDAVRVLSARPEVGLRLTDLKAVLLGDAATIGARRADILATVVSGANHCTYCGSAHGGMLAARGAVSADAAVQLFRDWRKVDELDEADRVMLEFAETLTFTPAQVTQADVDRLRAVGFSEVEVFDIVVLVAYRNFVNRVHDGLGVTTERLRDRFGEVVDALGE